MATRGIRTFIVKPKADPASAEASKPRLLRATEKSVREKLAADFLSGLDIHQASEDEILQAGADGVKIETVNVAAE